jgi:hypothetical protein
LVPQNVHKTQEQNTWVGSTFRTLKKRIDAVFPSVIARQCHHAQPPWALA